MRRGMNLPERSSLILRFTIRGRSYRGSGVNESILFALAIFFLKKGASSKPSNSLLTLILTVRLADFFVFDFNTFTIAKLWYFSYFISESKERKLLFIFAVLYG